MSSGLFEEHSTNSTRTYTCIGVYYARAASHIYLGSAEDAKVTIVEVTDAGYSIGIFTDREYVNRCYLYHQKMYCPGR